MLWLKKKKISMTAIKVRWSRNTMESKHLFTFHLFTFLALSKFCTFHTLKKMYNYQ